MAELLLELLSEEIPARMQQRAGDDFCRLVKAGLEDGGLAYGNVTVFTGPRRLALRVEDVAEETEARSIERKGPRIDAPAKALQGFLKSAGVTLEDCNIVSDKKGKFYLARIQQPGRKAAEVIAETIEATIAGFPWPKSMRWGAGSMRWVRPLHSILCCLDGKVVPVEIAGIRSTNKTRGHRFMAPAALTAATYEAYAGGLQAARVMIDADERIQAIRDQSRDLAKSDGLKMIEDEALLRENAGLVEWPVVLIGKFDEAFLDVPPEVIITTLKAHQKCFALRHTKGRNKDKLANRYLMVTNMVAPDGGAGIARGNDRVIAARLADARFFWELDRKLPLADRLPELDQIIFHAKLGSQRDRVDRIESLAGEIAEKTGADVGQTRLAARLCKADLVTGMVGEFPELQGLMGSYYAEAEEQPEAVCDAVRDHYKPQGPSDDVPSAPVARALALADKIDTLIGFWSIDEKPTGSKDPYALRRAALGVIRILLEGDVRLNLAEVFEGEFRNVLEKAAATVLPEEAEDGEESAEAINDDVSEATAVLTRSLLDFFADRLKVYLRDGGTRHDLIDAVFALGNQSDLLLIVRRVEALAAFLDTDDGANLLAGVKRATNILRIEEKKEAEKPEGERISVDGRVIQNLLVQGEEKNLHRAVEAAEANARKAVVGEDFGAAMAAMAKLRQPVDAFFDDVIVNADDPTFRENRLKLLARIRKATETVADFSRIEG